MNIEVTNRQRKYRIDRQSIKKNADYILSLCRAGDAELSILIVNNRAMRTLNRRYREIDKPTDVLAFPAPSPHRGEGRGEGRLLRFLGDIVISMEKVYAQAAERGHSPDTGVEILVIHGILHLLGYDHEVSDTEARRMRRKEKLILSGL